MKYIILLLAAVVVVQAQTNKGESFATNATYIYIMVARLT